MYLVRKRRIARAQPLGKTYGGALRGLRSTPKIKLETRTQHLDCGRKKHLSRHVFLDIFACWISTICCMREITYIFYSPFISIYLNTIHKASLDFLYFSVFYVFIFYSCCGPHCQTSLHILYISLYLSLSLHIYIYIYVYAYVYVEDTQPNLLLCSSLQLHHESEPRGAISS